MDKQNGLNGNEWQDAEFAEDADLHSFKGNAFSGDVNAVADQDGDSARYVVDDYSSAEEYASEGEFAGGTMAGVGTTGAITSLPDQAVNAADLDESANSGSKLTNETGAAETAQAANTGMTAEAANADTAATFDYAATTNSVDTVNAADGAQHTANADTLTQAPDQYNEEFAAEAAAAPGVGARQLTHPEEERPAAQKSERQATANAGAQGGAALGWIALASAILSLFLWPAVLGLAAVVLGAFAYARGRKGLGAWSVVIGLISFASQIIFAPMF